MKNEVLEMLERILAAFGRLHLPLIQAPNFKKGKVMCSTDGY